ncbi:hypothetical protein NCG97_13195 [Streptomyces lydicamycinicus]|uniref:Uncharacterized protein n=1 Tax=Streptomyces lydicamycinicus TaxID=1546107 RepID=A0A0P4R0R9_9ACTN|nr:hypothetical protein [Streptomyces lydicamycinicus]USA01408.1 hypothetical protein NCG97_13195 [Streptomyces lydicamycinicus]GAO06236.1 hypothetical protein TPA0598_01_06070 [Streptomyces lydicamycinicus]
MVTGVLDVMCAMGVVGVALVTGMADVAHSGRSAVPVRVRRRTPGRPGRLPRRRTAHLRPGQDGCARTWERGNGA